MNKAQLIDRLSVQLGSKKAATDAVEADPATEVTVDLGSRTVAWATPDGAQSAGFDIDDYTRWRLMEGLDDVDLTLRHEDQVAVFEAARAGWMPTTA